MEQRIIKFRAWDGRVMVDVWQVDHFGEQWKVNDDIDSTMDKWLIMQFIGLKDKNGIDIYKGDILKHNQNIYIVWWTENMGICLIHKKHFSPDKKSILTTDNRQDFNFIWSTQKYIEVIGNIYQNPELIQLTQPA